MPADPQKARELFLHAVGKLPAMQWETYVAEACAGDAGLEEHVKQLLKVHLDAGSFLDRPAAAVGATGDFAPMFGNETATIPPRDCSGTMIGEYKLLQQIGEGGMGTVFMAEQTEPVKRKVALKVIKPGMDSRQVIARFEAERQALAMMDHVNIARVFDGGATENGRPYFVMELVHGVPITKYCDDNHLTPRQRLEIFVPVCQAIQHAHQKGIIHRDIKPSNVMVTLYDGKPVPKVIDFGVAKATEQKLTERTLFTQYGTMVGTLEYMSPEQAEMSALGVDTRSDIYSLGVLLYELLTGSTPLGHKRLKEAAYGEILRMIKEEEPPKPSTRLSDSGEALASISANRHTEPAKLTKLVRGELDWIVMKCLEKDRGRRYETANGFAMDLQRYLNDETVQACPPSAGYRLRKFARRNKRGLAVAALVLFCVVLLGSGAGWMMRDRASRHAKVAAQVETIMAEVDRLEAEQKWSEALASARRAEAIVAGGEAGPETEQSVRERLKDHEFIEQLERIRMRRATWVGRGFDYVAADRGYAEAFRDYGVDVDQLAADTSAQRLKSRAQFAIPFAAALDDWVHVRRGMNADAADWTRLVAVARGVDPEPVRDRLRATWGRPITDVEDELLRLAASVDLRAQHPVTIERLATSLLRVNQPDAALQVLRGAQKVHAADFWLNFILAKELGKRGDHEGAARFYTAAVAIRPQATAALQNLGNSLRAQNKLDEAIACYRRAIEIDPQFAFGYNGLGIVLQDKGEFAEAVAAHRKAIECDSKFANAYIWLGHALSRQNKWDEAIAAYRKASELDPQAAATVHARIKEIIADKDLAVLRDRQDFKRLAADVETRRLLGDRAWELATDPEPSRRDPTRAVALAKNAVAQAPENADAWNTLGVARYRAGDFTGAVAALQQFRELRTGDAEGSNSFFLAMAHWQLGHKEEARRWYDRAAQWMAKNQPTDLELRRFRLEAQELLGVRDHRLFRGHTEEVRSVSLFPGGGRGLSASHDKTLRLWDLKGEKELHRFEGHTAFVTSVAVSPDGRRALSGAFDRTMRLWDVEAKKELRRFEHPEPVACVAFSPDGRLGLSGTLDTVHLWDLESGKEVRPFKGHAGLVRSVTFSTDGRMALSGGHDKTVRLWDVATGKEVRRFAEHTDLVLTVALSPDGRLALSGGSDRTVRVWEVGTGKEVFCLRGHQLNVEGLAFARDGLLAISGGAEGTIRLWDLKAGRELHCFGTDYVIAVAVSPDGREALTAHVDHGVRLWALPETGKESPKSGKDPER